MSKEDSENAGVRGSVDTTYHTQQRDMFTSGLAAEIGVYAFSVWHAIKSHADFKTGECWPGVRTLVELTGASNWSVQAALKTLEEQHLLRVTRLGKRNVYIARERLVIRLGARVLCTVAVDYVPNSMRETVDKLKKAAESGDMKDAAVWADVDVIPGPDMVYDPKKGTFGTKLRADEVPVQEPTALPDVGKERQKLRELSSAIKKGVPPG